MLGVVVVLDVVNVSGRLLLLLLPQLLGLGRVGMVVEVGGIKLINAIAGGIMPVAEEKTK